MSSSRLRIVFAGTPEFATRHLAALIGSDHDLVAVYTQPDRPAGRGKKLKPGPVKLLAQSTDIPVYQPPSLKEEAEQRRMAALNADVLVVVAYGLILPQAVLDIPRLGCLNVHASLLPRWRGAAPIARAIEAGDTVSGVTIMQMDAGLDTGDMLACEACPIGLDWTAASLHDELAAIGAPALLKVLGDLPAYQARAVKQDSAGATYAKKILKAEAEIDWGRDAGTIAAQVRAFNPAPACFTTVGAQRLKIWQASAGPSTDVEFPPGTITRADRAGIWISCGSGQLCITQLQMPGGKILAAEQLLNARREEFAPGTRLGGS